MAIKVENVSAKIIGIGDISILPGETKEIVGIFETNPMLKVYENTGLVKITGTPEPVRLTEDEVEDPLALSDEEKQAKLALLPGITEVELYKLANSIGINPASCRDQKDVLRRVKAALK